MTELSLTSNQTHPVTNFQDLVSKSFHGEVNAIYWARQLKGDFSEIVKKVEQKESITVLGQEELRELQLTKEGNLAREILLNDLKMLKAHGASPTLNLIKNYKRDDSYPFFPTDVYSFHVDRSPIPTDTFLCTYYGKSSEILPNRQAIQKVLVPEIRHELNKLYDGAEEGFESFLSEYFFDLHYQAQTNAQPISLGIGHLWKLAIEHPKSRVLPCLHRAPKELGQKRLLMIC